jgi:hypothetical protein
MELVGVRFFGSCFESFEIFFEFLGIFVSFDFLECSSKLLIEA